MKLSIIVPVYNVEPYLSACLDSLLEQGLPVQDYEIICVDDGSTDRSGEIAENYAERCSQVSVIHQLNGGLSAARNTGLQAAAGEYLCFVDSDDLLEKNVLDGLYRLAVAYDLDQLLFNYQRFEDGTEPPHSVLHVDPDRLTLFPTPLEMRKHKAVPAWRVAWNYLVRRNVLETFDLSFQAGALFEDQEFNFWLDRCAGPCGFLDQPLYLYRKRPGSILDSFQSDERFPAYIHGRLELAALHHDRLLNFRSGIRPKLRTPVSEPELEWRWIDEVQGILNRLLAKGDPILLQQTLTLLREQNLYPYPLRWKRLLRKNPFKKRTIDAVSFLYPVEWYLRLTAAVRIHLP